MVLLPGPVHKKIKRAVSANDVAGIQKTINAAILHSGRRERKELSREITGILVESALKTDNPDILLAVTGLSYEGFSDHIPEINQHYVKTRDAAWLNAILAITKRLARKSNQSVIISDLIKTLVEAGVTGSNRALIEHGLALLNRIIFKKYRSEILIVIIPLLMDWAVRERDTGLLKTACSLIGDVSDLSKRSVLYNICAQSIATIALLENKPSLFIESLRIACTIRQKTRREMSISSIIGKAVQTTAGEILHDIPGFIHPFYEFEKTVQLEIISALMEHLIENEKDETKVLTALHEIAARLPFAQDIIIHNLLKKAEKDGSSWHLIHAVDFQNTYKKTGDYPIHDIVRAGISIARHSHDTEAFSIIIPVIEKNSDIALSSRVFIQLALVMLAEGKFKDAFELYARIGHGQENLPFFIECSVSFFKNSVIHDSISPVRDLLMIKQDKKIYYNAINRAAIDISKTSSYQDITHHINSLQSLILLHPQHDQIILDSISILTTRGFLDAAEPDILIRFLKPIRDPAVKEQALSTIVIKLAKIGVKTKNRDYLQRAVGLTCLIEEEKTRSATLTSIIDEATVLAVQDGDLDLLRRMRDWSASLLSRDIKIFATAKIIDGMVTYAIDKKSVNALEEAYLISQDIHDPSLKKELIERICECFVKIGCLFLKDDPALEEPDEIRTAIYPFRRGMELLILHGKHEDRSINIAHLIDIILEFLQQHDNPHYVVPLVVYALEIENTYERHAMISRIVSNIKVFFGSIESTDPYEIMVDHLQHIGYIQTDPVLLDSVVHLATEIKDPFLRLSRLLTLAASYLRLDQREKSEKLLRSIHLSLNQVLPVNQKVSILTGLALHYEKISEQSAQNALSDALNLLPEIEYDRESAARKQIAMTIAGLYPEKQDPALMQHALEIIKKIDDPSDYTDAMMSVYRTAQENPEWQKDIIIKILEKCDSIPSPTHKALILLDIVPFVIGDDDDRMAYILLKHIVRMSRSIRIPFIADTVRTRISLAYMMISDKKTDEKARVNAIEIAKEIDNDETRLFVLDKIGYTGAQNSSYYTRIKEFTGKILAGGKEHGQIDALEKLIRLSPNRPKTAQIFCNIAAVFKRNGKPRIAKRFVAAATGEARITRPLSQRAYVLCDIAMILNAARCLEEAQGIIELAINAATNIRQFYIRDEVFDDLAYAMRFMRE